MKSIPVYRFPQCQRRLPWPKESYTDRAFGAGQTIYCLDCFLHQGHEAMNPLETYIRELFHIHSSEVATQEPSYYRPRVAGSTKSSRRLFHVSR